MDREPRPLAEVDLPEEVRRALAPGEIAYFHAQPIRHANGIGVWMIMGLGGIFLFASVGGLVETLEKLQEAGARVLGVGALLLAIGFVAFSLLLLAWPLLSFRRMRRTHVVVTDRCVVELVRRGRAKAPRVRSWSLAECTDASVARRRGASATLVLKERVRERRTDGQTIYEWEALHGLPRADEALAVLVALRADPRNSAGDVAEGG